MSQALVLFLPEHREGIWRWLRLAGDAIVARGEDIAAIQRPVAGPADAERVVAVAPAATMTLGRAELPDLAPAQAQAAARLLAFETSIQPIDLLHVAVGEADADGGGRPMATVETARMAEWLAALAARGFDPDAIIPSPLLLPRPELGFVRGDLGGETVLRGRDGGFVDDPVLSPLLVGDAPVEPLTREAIERSIAAGIAEPQLDLRQGAFARRRRWTIGWAQIRRLLVIAGIAAAVSLAIVLVMIMRYSFAADALERQSEVAAAAALPAGTGQGNAVARLDERLAELRGGGYGFSATAGAVFAAVQAVPGIDLNAMTFERDGTMKLTLSAANPDEVRAMKARLEALGLKVPLVPLQQADGRYVGDVVVRP